MGARERLRGLPVWDGQPIQKAPCFAYEVSALQKDVVNTGCLYSKSPDRKTSSAFKASAGPSEPFVKAVLSLAEKLLRKLIGKVLTYVCGFR